MPQANATGCAGTRTAGSHRALRSATALVLAAAAIGIAAPQADAGTGSIELSLEDGTSPTQMGRIFRDAIPSSCPSKAYPGIFNAGATYLYETYTFTAPLGGCAEFTRTSSSCATNAHLSLYDGAYDPADQATNFLGDQGSSVDNDPFKVELLAGQKYVLALSNTGAVENCLVTADLRIPGYSAPDTVLDSGPAAAINTNVVAFEFSGDPSDETAKIQCRFDSDDPADWADCTSPVNIAGVAEGDHTAEFRAENAEGFQDASPATTEFTVDTAPPDTTIDSGPTGTVTTNKVSFEFSGTPTGDVDHLQCRLDDEQDWSTCTSPKTFGGLADGAHSARFRAVDAAGNADPTPASRDFTVDTPEGSGNAQPPQADTSAPQAKVSAKGKQKAKRAVKVKVGSDEAATAAAEGEVIAKEAAKPSRASAAARKRKFKLAETSAPVAAGGEATLKLKPEGGKSKRRKTTRKLVELVERGAKAKAKITVTLTDAAGNRSVEQMAVKLK